MKSVCLILFLSAFAGASAGAAGKDHPVVKVIKLLEDLKGKAVAEGKSEEVSYGKFTYWCSTSKAELKDSIADEKETIDELNDMIDGQTKEIDSLAEKISELEDQIKDLEASAKTAKDDRADEAKLYKKADKDLSDTIKAVDDCIKALEGAEGKTEAKMMLAQGHVQQLMELLSLKVSEKQLKTLSDFAADPKKRPKQLAAGDEAAHVDKYDFKSENVIELLKQLKLKFEDDKLAGTKGETNSLNAYDLAKEARDNTIDAAKKSKDKKTKTKGATEKAKAQAVKDRQDTKDDLGADTNSLSTTDESCSTKKSEWEQRSATRSNEIAAMDAAIGILGKATGVRTEAPGNPIPPASPVKLFIQLSDSEVTDPKMKAVALLRQAAQDTHSKAMERLAMEVSAHLKGPFDGVNNMIEKMIFRLMDEQKQEDEHKLWCDKETEKTNTMKDDKEDKIKDLQAEIKVENAAVSKLTDDLKTAANKLSDIVSFKKEATEIRSTGKSENKLAIKDSQDAQTAVTNAMAVLVQFYKESGSIKKEPWEFIQKPVTLSKDPATWEAGYNQVSAPNEQPGGIVTVLEEINAKFAQMEAETKAQESSDQKEYEEAMKANSIEQARLTKEEEMKTAEKARRVDKVSSLESTKKDTMAELEKTDQYLLDLKPACENTDKGASYDDRKAARAKEIKALKDAQLMLLDAFKETGKKGKFLQISRH